MHKRALVQSISTTFTNAVAIYFLISSASLWTSFSFPRLIFLRPFFYCNGLFWASSLNTLFLFLTGFQTFLCPLSWSCSMSTQNFPQNPCFYSVIYFISDFFVFFILFTCFYVLKSIIGNFFSFINILTSFEHHSLLFFRPFIFTFINL